MRAPHALATMSRARCPVAQTSVLVVVDVAYVVGYGAGRISAGIYMFDDQLSNGSAAEGTLDLSTRCHLGDVISWEVMPLDPFRGDRVEIASIALVRDGLFGAGYPTSWPNTGNWYGQAMSAGSATYQMTVKLTTGALRPAVYTAYWNASVTDVTPAG